MSRRVYLLGVGLALVALALAFTDWALGLRPGVTEANVKRIQTGMTLAEVEFLLGSWPTEESVVARELAVSWVVNCYSTRLSWFAPRGEARVYFRAGGRVEAAEWVLRPDGASKGDLPHRLRAWLGW
jgi:hypothetical protein